MKETVLLIEDEKIMRVTLEDALRAGGYGVLSFSTGTAGLDAINSALCNVVVTDVRLPDMDGFDIVREITRRGGIQVIVMTAYGTIKDAVEAMKLGAFDYLTKPFSLAGGARRSIPSLHRLQVPPQSGRTQPKHHEEGTSPNVYYIRSFKTKG